MNILPILSIFLLLTVCADAHRWPTSKSNTCSVTNGCNRLPSKRCQMSDSTFRSTIVGNTYAALYHIAGYSDDAPTRNQHRFRYTAASGMDQFKFMATFRAVPTDAACMTDNSDPFSTLVTNRKRRAIYDADITFPATIGPQMTRFYYVSSRPSEYLISFLCLDKSTISRNRCNGRFLVEVAVPTSTQDPPNTVNWYKIELELRKCLGLRLSDSRSLSAKRGDECTNP